MNILIVRLADTVMAGLIAGTLWGIWIGYNPRNLSVQTYIEQQQSVIKALNILMPLLGFLTIIITFAAAFLQKNNPPVFITLLIATGLLILAGLITKFGNQPINSIVITWDTSAVPFKWQELRDKWWLLHKLRALASLLAFGLIAWSNINKN